MPTTRLEWDYSPFHVFSKRAEENIISTFSFHIWNRSKILLSLVQSNLGPDSNNPIAIFNALC